jgi:DNA invertase Pin-like site-specific DNA recombinase
MKQVLEHQESTKRQYALRQQAKTLGWSLDSIIVIDDDLGQSGTSAEDRGGFQRLVAETGMGNAGIVMGLEVSRLARNNADWHRLLEICALTKTLILDEDGLYDPSEFNDRLLLGMKGTMSEAELHMIRMRLRGGRLSKASRGELKTRLPIGYVYDSEGHTILDPDKQVQARVRLVFELYSRLDTAGAVVQHFHDEKILFPHRSYRKANKGELTWRLIRPYQVFSMLHNPRYAGAYAYGRQVRVKYPHRKDRRIKCPAEEWHTLIPNTHEPYISWAEYQANKHRLKQCRPANCNDLPKPPREGHALLQGIALCGICGRRMSIRYHKRRSSGCLTPGYICACNRAGFKTGSCQYITGDKVDIAIGELLMEVVTPMSLEVALNVQQELLRRFEQTDMIRRQQVERAQYEASLAKRRYMQVDPDHRLVADSLENEWNTKLQALHEATQQYERLRQEDMLVLDDQKKKRIMDLARDFPRLWKNPKVSHRERKQMVRLLIEDVTLVKSQEVKIHVRFKGGATRTLSVPRSKSAWELNKTDPELVNRIDELLDDHNPGEIASILNQKGFKTGTGTSFAGRKVDRIQRRYGLKSRSQRLREKGLLTRTEIAKVLGVDKRTITEWRRQGRLKTQTYTDNGALLYEPPDPAKTKRYEHTQKQVFAQS